MTVILHDDCSSTSEWSTSGELVSIIGKFTCPYQEYGELGLVAFRPINKNLSNFDLTEKVYWNYVSDLPLYASSITSIGIVDNSFQNAFIVSVYQNNGDDFTGPSGNFLYFRTMVNGEVSSIVSQPIQVGGLTDVRCKYADELYKVYADNEEIFSIPHAGVSTENILILFEFFRTDIRVLIDDILLTTEDEVLTAQCRAIQNPICAKTGKRFNFAIR